MTEQINGNEDEFPVDDSVDQGEDCVMCGGTGLIDDSNECYYCDGTGETDL